MYQQLNTQQEFYKRNASRRSDEANRALLSVAVMRACAQEPEFVNVQQNTTTPSTKLLHLTTETNFKFLQNYKTRTICPGTVTWGSQTDLPRATISWFISYNARSLTGTSLTNMLRINGNLWRKDHNIVKTADYFDWHLRSKFIEQTETSTQRLAWNFNTGLYFKLKT